MNRPAQTRARPRSVTVLLLLLLGVCITLLDLWTKGLARRDLIQGIPKPVLGDFFRFTLTYNYGVTFGLFGGSAGGIRPLVLSLMGIAALGVVLYFFLRLPVILRDGAPQAWGRVVLAAITGGALGNILDRLLHGRVTDFLDIGIGSLRWYTFNIADSFVVVGSIILAGLLFFFEKKPLSQSQGEQTG